MVFIKPPSQTRHESFRSEESLLTVVMGISVSNRLNRNAVQMHEECAKCRRYWAIGGTTDRSMDHSRLVVVEEEVAVVAVERRGCSYGSCFQSSMTAG
jgi:hypothetical protein